MFSQPGAWVVQISALYSACEWLSGFPFEVKVIWGNSDLPLVPRCVYFLARYLGLIGQIIYLITFQYMSRIPKPTNLLCDIYWSTQHAMGTLSMALLSFIAAKRVFALWNCDYRMGVFMSLLLGSHLICHLLVGLLGIKAMTYNSHSCFVVEQYPKEIVYLAISNFTVYSFIWSLGYFKYMTLKEAIRSIDAVRLLTRINRENFVVSVFTCVVPAALIFDGLGTKLAPKMNPLTFAAFPAFLTITTSATCRTVKNMYNMSEKIREDMPNGDFEETLMLTPTVGGEPQGDDATS